MNALSLARRRMLRWIGALVLAGFLPVATTGCFGGFELTRKIYRFNERVDPDQWVQWMVFLVLNVVPIYAFAVTLDVLFANSVEFWTGSNPILGEAERRRTVWGPGGERATATLREDGALDVELVEPDGTRHRLTLVRDGASVEARDASGRALARLVGLGGAPRVLSLR